MEEPQDVVILLNASCLDETLGVGTIPDRSIDLICTDPPYSEKVHRKSRRGITNYKERKGAEAREARNRDLGFAHLDPDFRLAVARQFARVARRWVLIFTDQEGVGTLPTPRNPDGEGWIGDLTTSGLEYVRTGIWHKLGATPQMTGDRPAAAHECIVIAHQTSNPARRPIKKRWNGGGRHAHWSYPIVLDRSHTGARVHPTQKPLELLTELVELFSDPGEIVLDPFTGSGTTGVACRTRDRSFIGYELDERWAEIARRRIAGKRAIIDPSQGELFDG